MPSSRIQNLKPKGLGRPKDPVRSSRGSPSQLEGGDRESEDSEPTHNRVPKDIPPAHLFHPTIIRSDNDVTPDVTPIEVRHSSEISKQK